MTGDCNNLNVLNTWLGPIATVFSTIISSYVVVYFTAIRPKKLEKLEHKQETKLRFKQGFTLCTDELLSDEGFIKWLTNVSVFSQQSDKDRSHTIFKIDKLGKFAQQMIGHSTNVDIMFDLNIIEQMKKLSDLCTTISNLPIGESFPDYTKNTITPLFVINHQSTINNIKELIKEINNLCK